MTRLTMTEITDDAFKVARNTASKNYDMYAS